MPYLKNIEQCPEPIDCKILTAALDLFVEKGYHNVSIHEIQKQADVSIGSIYKYFGSKEGIAKALYKHLLNEFDELANEAIEAKPSPIEQYKEIIRKLFEYTETRRNIIAFLFHTKHSDFITENNNSSCFPPFLKVQNIVKQGIKSGEFKNSNSIIVANALLGSSIALIQLRLDGCLDKPLIDYYESIVDTWNGVITSC